MMFLYHIAFALGLIAISTGALLFAYGSSKDVGLAKLLGLIVIILSILSTLCTGYYGMKSWQGGYFQGPPAAMSKMNNGKNMNTMEQTNKKQVKEKTKP